jgi:CO/xanthine dehydrogenase FAD-binding subunit
MAGGTMRTAISSLDYRCPRSLEEALELQARDPRTPLAGATDLYVALNFGTLETRRFLDLGRLEALRTIERRGDNLVIGALATYTGIIRSPLVNDLVPMLVSASRQIGGVQIQNRGTLGGNIANASPAGDSLPVLFAVNAIVVLRSTRGERRVPITEFYTGYRKTVLKPDELIVAVEIPPIGGRQYFRKVGTRAAQAISKVVFAGVQADAPSIALGSVGPTVIRARATEQALRDGAKADQAVAVLQQEITPIDDLRSSADYRRVVAGNLLRHFLAG